MKLLKYARKHLKSKNFRVYCVIGLIVWIVGTIMFYVGRELLLINVVWLSPIVAVVGFVLKYLLYDWWGLLKDE